MKNIKKIFYWLVFILIPLFLIMTSVRILVNPKFPEFEYSMPGFPTDSYGLSDDERLYWSRFAVDYLLNSADISYLADLNFENGKALFNERELRHMQDVKTLVQSSFTAWYIILALIMVIGLWSWFVDNLYSYGQSLKRGGILTIALIVSIIIATMVSFQGLFTGFHRIFFKGDTWIFLYTDTLIRLFPLRFWQDAFIYMGTITLIGAGVSIYVGNVISKKIRES